MSAGEVAVQIGRALWTTNPWSLDSAKRQLAYEEHKRERSVRVNPECESYLPLRRDRCTDPDPAVEPHDWLEIPEIGNQFLEICVRCQAQRINYQRQFAHERHLRGL